MVPRILPNSHICFNEANYFNLAALGNALFVGRVGLEPTTLIKSSTLTLHFSFLFNNLQTLAALKIRKIAENAGIVTTFTSPITSHQKKY